jgi:hypothetical protein
MAREILMDRRSGERCAFKALKMHREINAVEAIQFLEFRQHTVVLALALVRWLPDRN